MTALSKVAITVESLGRPGCERGCTAGMQGNSISIVGAPFAVTMSVSVSKSLDRPVCEGRGMARVQGNSISVVGTPLAVTVSNATITKMVLGHSLEGASMSGMGLADGVLGVQLMAVDVITVLKGGDTVAVGLSTPLAVSMAVSVSDAGVSPGHLLVGS